MPRHTYFFELITINNKFEIHLDINKDYQSYGRCIIDGCIYSTNNYCKSHKTDNSYIYSNNKYGMIYSIFALPNICLCNNECSCLSLIVFVENVTSTDSCFSTKEIYSNIVLADFIHKCNIQEDISAWKSEDIQGKCFSVICDEDCFFIKLPLFEKY